MDRGVDVELGDGRGEAEQADGVGRDHRGAGGGRRGPQRRPDIDRRQADAVGVEVAQSGRLVEPCRRSRAELQAVAERNDAGRAGIEVLQGESQAGLAATVDDRGAGEAAARRRRRRVAHGERPLAAVEGQ